MVQRENCQGAGVIQFDPETHSFSADGRRIPSVTQILKAGGWIDDHYYTEQGRKRGENVHQATALLDQQILDWTSLSEEIRAYVEAYERARAELKLGIRRIEYIVHKGRMFAGIEDREAMWERQLTVVDLKTGTPTLADKLQIAGYGATHVKPPRLLLLYLRPDGYKAVELEPGKREEFTLAWHQIVSIYHWRLKNGNGKR
jgi:hypothetical protein